MNARAPKAAAKPDRRAVKDGRVRAVIDRVIPEIDGGRFPVKRVAGDTMIVEADVFTDGHDTLTCMLGYKFESDADWIEVPMKALGNDRWSGEFVVERVGRYRYTVTAWVDHFLSWRNEFKRRVDPADIASAALVGSKLIAETANRAARGDAQRLRQWGKQLVATEDTEELKRLVLDEDLAGIAMRYPDRRYAAVYERELAIVVDRLRARFSSWYEFFPRSMSAKSGRHGTFRDCEKHLAYVAELGFDVLYLPPIHPIGRAKRKGKNNALEAGAGEPGSPWAIGSEEGGHKAIHPELGTLDDFRRLVAKARELDIDIALDIAFQTAPDHPYVKAHPEWFTWRPDGTVQYAENPPKKYQDIYPFNFESEDWLALWDELKSVFDYWIAQGVTVFRVDNPHTKPFLFWEWAVNAIKAEHPEVIFLAEAFTRPKVMHRLAKLGYTQSYTYFAWRNTKHELTEYFNELAHGPGREYFRPNVWPNTPDILTEYMQHGGRPAFIARLLLASTLAANYGIYGPAFELSEHAPREPGSEEYLHSEKYEIRTWDLEREDSLRYLIARVNAIRKENAALQDDSTLSFAATDNDALIAYVKATADLSNVLLVIVNLDPHHRQSGWIDLDLGHIALEADIPYQVHDLLTDAQYVWHGRRNYVELPPGMGHIFAVRRRVRDERDFDYFQ
ncbi:MAG TPA: alpha-1,4-glucan--maltose-1-phosphate maltosyltransferase [Burkholderiales bacterium]|nr:alpha-1,4-glucan--maltose-1-phosphate maltosyltransferase [Burkholderiales bacterium]